jgi:hypothetical protein
VLRAELFEPAATKTAKLAPFVVDFDVVFVGAACAGMYLLVGRCTVAPNPADPTFDMRLGAGGLDGSLAFASRGSDLVVHFTAATGDP